jgi:quercetin dioxygenase-like cupin family protein
MHEEEHWQRGSRTAKTLLKAPDLRVTLVALKAGAQLDDHEADGSATVHGLQGRLLITVEGAVTELLPGQLLILPPHTHHTVEAVENSAFLLSVGWRHA